MKVVIKIVTNGWTYITTHLEKTLYSDFVRPFSIWLCDISTTFHNGRGFFTMMLGLAWVMLFEQPFYDVQLMG